MNLNKIISILFLISMVSCTTSLKIRDKGSEPVDSVKTLKAPPAGGKVAPVDVDTERADENTQRRFDQMKGELENLRFLSEKTEKEMQNRITMLETENAKLTADLIAAQKNGGSSADSSGKTAEETSKLLWDSGLAALQKNDKSRALDSFRSLVDTYPKSEHAHPAHVALGLLNYSQQNYKEAALHFNTAIEKYPKKRSGISLVEFGVAASVYQLGNKDDAKLFFEELVRKYPKSAATPLAKAILARKAKVPEDLFKSFPNWLDQIR